MIQFFIHDGQKEKGLLDIEGLKSEPLKNDTPIGMKDLTIGQLSEK